MIIGSGFDYLIGYVDNEQVLITLNPEQITAFIMKYALKDIKITSPVDEEEIATCVGGFITFCRDQEYLREKLLPVLSEVQMGNKKADEFIPYHVAIDYNNCDKSAILLEIEKKGTNGFVTVLGKPLNSTRTISKIIDVGFFKSIIDMNRVVVERPDGSKKEYVIGAEEVFNFIIFSADAIKIYEYQEGNKTGNCHN